MAALIPALVAGSKAAALGALGGAASYGVKKGLKAATTTRKKKKTLSYLLLLLLKPEKRQKQSLLLCEPAIYLNKGSAVSQQKSHDLHPPS